MTPNEEDILERIAVALEALAAPKYDLRVAEEGEKTPAEHRAWYYDICERDCAAQERIAEALEAISVRMVGI